MSPKSSSANKMLEKLKQGIKGACCHKTDMSVQEPTADDSLPLEYTFHDLTPAMLEEAEMELNETDESRNKALEEFRSLIKKERNLRSPLDDGFLLAFLRSRKFSVRRSLRLLQNYWSFRRDHRAIYDATDSGPVRDLIFRNVIGFLPHRDRLGCVVVVFKLGSWDPALDPYEVMFRCMTALLVHSIQFPATQVCGYRVIVDARGLSWKQVKLCTPHNALLLVHSTQYCFPARYKGFHILSENKLFSIVWAIFQPCMTNKLRKRMMLHGTDLKPLLEFIHPSILPDEFGGEAGPFENSSWGDVIDADEAKVMDMLQYGYQD